jgi:xylan 1,4-beta-xylosidase
MKNNGILRMKKQPGYLFWVKLVLIVTSIMINNYFANGQKSATVILPGDYPDPSIVCVNNEYYLTNSTHFDNPGLPVWHSSDLKNWNRISYALNQTLGDVWAPDIVYYKKLWYIYFTALVNGMANFVVTADNPAGPWSDPIRLNAVGIDPGHIVTPDGKRYLYMSAGGLVELDSTGKKVIGKQRNVYNPWPIPEDYVVECVCAEGPKPLYYNGYYYLVIAQGGTSGPSTSHMAIAMRSKNVDGPWDYSPYNPVIHTKDQSEKWWSTGHGTLFQGAMGKWYMVFHSYEHDFRNLGRQVLITPVEWTKDGWFYEAGSTTLKDVIGSNFIDEFDSPALDLHWVFSNDSATNRITLKDGQLVLNSRGKSSGDSNPMLITAEHHRYQITTKVAIQNGATAGLLLYYNNEVHWGIALSPDGIVKIERNPMQKRPVFNGPVKTNEGMPKPNEGGSMPPMPNGAIRLNEGQSSVFLRIINDRSDISFYYSLDGEKWTKLERSYDISGFDTNTVGGYKSFKAGIFSAGSGNAVFDYFKYQNSDNL